MKATLKLIICALLFCTSIGMRSQTTDVWDFGAAQLDAGLYNNLLNESAINSWYEASVTPGSTGVNLPMNFTAGALSWVGASSDRLRTSNTALSRFDTNVASVTTHNGRLYCNGIPTLTAGLPASRYVKMTLAEDDEIQIIARGDTAGILSFVNESNPALQNDTFAITSASASITEVNFVAQTAGIYRIFDATAKASFYRIYRKAAVYTNVSGNLDTSLATGIPANYAVVFTNAAGKSWTAQMNSGSYNVSLPVGHAYEISLVNANGYIVSNGTAFTTVGVSTPEVSRHISILQVDLHTLSGTISGLGTSISNLELTYAPATNAVYVPVCVVDAVTGNYSVQLEANVLYNISASGVNDFQMGTNAITIPASNTSADIVFTAKPTYAVTITTLGLNATQLNDLNLTFTNLNENGYSYTFSTLSPVALRNGSYEIKASGLDNHPVELALSSNLNINSASASKTISFNPVTVWSFNDKVISTSTSGAYKGMLLTGQVSTVIASGHLTAKSGATIKVPVNVGDKISVSYYYTANFSIEGGMAVTTATNSTSIVENVEYNYAGIIPGFVTISVGGDASLTTYFTEIKIGGSIAYDAEITVGTDKDYQTINAALKAVSNMTRTANDRVTILIDSGNYEEMLVINQPNITLKNASLSPNINLTNKGVDINDGAVRITSYYGHGYSYYSMSNDQKWHQDVLDVNTENGYLSYQNTGAGTTNGSYWNATVVVTANGFTADGIIFENSFNQYISLKESQDIIVPFTTGSPGVRPTNVGNTTVQNRTMVERAAALAIANNVDKAILNKCRIVGRQDSFFGGTGARVAVYKGNMMGAVDYIFGGMDAVFYQSKLSMNVSDQSNDQSYITAAQQSSGRGYLMYECTITSAEPLVETASTFRAKPGYFGRPWQANTSEVVFYNSTIETSDYTGSVGNSLIMPLGWQNTLGGTSAGMYEFGTTEVSGVNNIANRASWSTSLTTPMLNDGTAISTFNFTKGLDNWDPFPQLIADDLLGNDKFTPNSSVKFYAYKNTVAISGIKSKTAISVYTINGSLVKTFQTVLDTKFILPDGLWIVRASSADGEKSIKVITR